MILFGIVGILAGVLAFVLPETLGIKLPETVEEAEKIWHGSYFQFASLEYQFYFLWCCTGILTFLPLTVVLFIFLEL